LRPSPPPSASTLAPRAVRLAVLSQPICKWLHELEHYGFIVMVQGALLGVHGTGKAAHYRLTDCPFAGQSPTYDFQNWDGVLYATKKQNPVPHRGDITSLTTSRLYSAPREWTMPRLEEIEYTPELRRLYREQVKEAA
jgi:hypothetical protein